MNTKALFYPAIEINDKNWLKANLLFWDEIYTIVPHSFNNPYTNRITEILSEREIIKPEYVNPDHIAVKELSQYILEFINTEEGLNLLHHDTIRGRIHRDKRSRIHFDQLSRLHSCKMLYELRSVLEHEMDEDWISMDSNFAAYYMTMLANKICEQTGYRLLPDNPLYSNLLDNVKLGIEGLSLANREYGLIDIERQL